MEDLEKMKKMTLKNQRYSFKPYYHLVYCYIAVDQIYLFNIVS